MHFDVVVENAQLVTPGSISGKSDVGIEAGRIAAIAAAGTLPPGDETIDAKGRPVLPGLVDAHTHLGEWGSFERECETETMGAAVGGVTTAILMLKRKNLPSHLAAKGSYLDVFDEFVSIIEKHSLINIAFRPYPMTADQIREIPDCVSHLGARGFKFVMHFRAGTLEAEMAGAHALDDGTLLDAFRQVGRAGGIACVHAENQDIIDFHAAQLERAGRDDLAAWADSRPNISELEAIQRVALLAHEARCPLYIVHVTAAESVDFIAEARQRGRLIRAETCPHYLTLLKTDPSGKLAKTKPPIRDEASRDRLWRGLREGVIDCVSSDHMPGRRLERAAEPIWSCQWGFPKVETMLPLLLSEGVAKGRLSLERLVELCSLNPARIFGLYPQKGHLSVGADADLVIVDLAKRAPVRQRSFPSSSDFSLYEGWELTGWPVLTMIRGRIVMRDGEIVAKPGGGQYVRQGPLHL